MNKAAPRQPRKRAYRQGARADAMQAATDRILDVFSERLREDWFDHIRLEDVAQQADVSIQTILRRFGGKEGLLEAAQQRIGQEIMARRAVPKGDIAAAVRALVDDYEKIGDLVMRSLAQEDRYPAIRQATDFGRAEHRSWVADVFSPWLNTLPGGQARLLLDALVVATDLYVWKLIRRDLRRPIGELRALMQSMIQAALDHSQAKRRTGET